MKILQVVNVRWFNAAADYALRLCVGLRNLGHDVHVAGLPGTRPLLLAEGRGLPIIPLPGLNSNNPFLWPRTYRKIRRLVSSEGYDLVCAHFSEGYALLAAAARRTVRPPALVRTRGDTRPPRRGRFNRKLYGEWTDGLAVSGKVVRDLVAMSLGIEGAGIRIIYYGTDVKTFHPRGYNALSARPGDGWPPVVGYVGRLDRIKGDEHLVRVLSLIAASIDRVSFLLAVREEEGQPGRLKRELQQAGLMDRTTLLGEVGDVAGIMNRFSVGIVPSIASEVNCRVLQEMMACGVPTVATRVGVIPEVLEDGATGLLVPPGNPGAMASGAIRILKDRELRHKMALSSRQRAVEKFSLKVMVDVTERWYLEIIAGKEGIVGF